MSQPQGQASSHVANDERVCAGLPGRVVQRRP